MFNLNPRAMVERLEPRQLLAVNVTVDASQQYQTIDGFGTALAWWNTSPYDNPAFRDLYYRDLGASMLRVDMNINTLRGPDNNIATPVTMVDDIQTNINQFDFHWLTGGQNFGEIAMSAASHALDDFKLIGSLWTPPHWMKGPERDSNGNLNGNQPTVVSGGNDSSGGTLIDTPENLEQFGRYVAAYVKGFEQTYGVKFYAISIQNELAFHEPYNSCVYYPALYVKALKAVRSAFDYYGIDTQIQGPEDVGVGSPSTPGILERQFKYINAVRADPVANEALDIYSIHGVAGDSASNWRSTTMWGQYVNGRFTSPTWTGIGNDGKKSWMTETSGESHSIGGSMRMLGNAFDALISGNVSAWLYWQTSRDNSNYTGESLTAGVDSSGVKFNVMRQLFQHVRPGAVRIGSTVGDPYGVYTISFMHPQQKTVTTILLNQTTSSQTIDLTLQGANVASFPIARRTSSTDRHLNLGTVTLNNSQVSLVLPAQSVVTLQGYIQQTISGNVFNDLNGNGVRDGNEPGINKRKVFHDVNGNGALDANEPWVLSDVNGNYVLAGLTNGPYSIRQELPANWSQTTNAGGANGVVLAAGASVSSVNLGTQGTNPTISNFRYDIDTSKPSLKADFSADVIDSLEDTDPVITNLNTGATMNFKRTLNYYDGGTNARWKLYQSNGTVPLPDGNYRATLPIGSITDNGTPAATPASVDFYVLGGDANRDRKVDTQDFNLMAHKFGTGGKFSQGDFDYNQQVNSSDFNIFVAQYGRRLDPAPGPELAPLSAPAVFAEPLVPETTQVESADSDELI